MIKKINFIDTDLKVAEAVRSFMSLQNVKTESEQVDVVFDTDPQTTAEARARASRLALHNEIKLGQFSALNETTLCAVRENETHFFYGSGTRSLEEALSNYILAFHSYTVEDLSCRNDSQRLESYIEAGSPNLLSSPHDWIYGNKLFKEHGTELFDRLARFVLNERGMFLKVWKLDCEKNYWNSALNGGVPVTKKRDEIHEGTFLLHDMFHFLFKDPFIAGDESPEEAKAYIAYRMMSEACTQVLADMIGVSQARLDETGYDIERRRIFPVFKSTSLNAHDFESMLALMRANSRYCLQADDSEYLRLGVNVNDLDSFKDKYGIYFSVDFEWNEKNIAYMTSNQYANNRTDYSRMVCGEVTSFSVKTLYSRVKSDNGGISFEKLFAVFTEQLIEMMAYNKPYSQTAYARSAARNYLSGQALLAFSHPHPNASVLVDGYQLAMRQIEASSTTEQILEAYNTYVSTISDHIERLGTDGILLPHEKVLFRLHVPHFPPNYCSYDLNKQQYVPHDVIAKRILGKYLNA